MAETNKENLPTPLRILHLEDNPLDAELIDRTLTSQGLPHAILPAKTRDEFRTALERGTFDIILADYSLPDIDGMEALALWQKHSPDTPFIFLTGALGEETAINTLRCGATDYVLKDKLSRLLPAIIRAMEESRNRKNRADAEEALRQSEERFRQMAEYSRDVFHLIDTESERALYVSPAFERLWGFPVEEIYQSSSRIIESIHQEDREQFLSAWPVILAGKDFVLDYRIVRSDGEIRWIHHRAFPIRRSDGQVYRVAGMAEDVTDRKREELLREALVREKMAVLLKEIHHRVKNNLQIISSLLNLQAGYIADEPILSMFRESQDRVKSMALIHEKLYHSENLERIHFASYIRSLVLSLFASYQIKPENIELTLDLEDALLDLDMAIPCGLIINELLSNALKHAFQNQPNKSKPQKNKVTLRFRHQENTHLLLMISDNGRGIPHDILAGPSKTLGLRLVRILADQLHAAVQTKNGSGTQWSLEIPLRQGA